MRSPSPLPEPNLQNAIHGLPVPDSPLMLLPAAHLAPAGCFSAIVNEGKIQTHYSKTLGAELLYLSYGGIHFRGRAFPTEDSGQLPVGFLFEPAILNLAARAFPFDSGAAATGRFGPEWTARLGDFRAKYQIALKDGPRELCNLVFHLYGRNDRYLEGAARNACADKPAPFPELCDFLSADLSHLGVDHRQRSIECIFESALIVGRSLLWIAYPSSMGRHVQSLYKWTKPWVPELFSYSGRQNANPAEVAAILEHEASRIVQRFIELPQ